MSAAHKALIAKAEADGLLPMERDASLIVHDMVNITRAQMARYEVGYNKMTEKQQDAVLGELADGYKALALTMARTLASAGVHAVPMTLKDLKIANGTLTGIVDGSEQYFNELISKVQDKSEVLIVLYEREYDAALSHIESEKDQRPLDLEGDKTTKAKATRKNAATKAADLAPAKEVKLTPKLIADGRDFVTIQQNATLAGIQNHLKIGIDKAEALLKLYEGEGLVKFVGTDQNGHYELVRASAVKPEPLPVFDAATLEVMYSTACREVIKASSADDSVMRQVYGDDDNLIELALMRMEEDGIVSAPSKEGLRDVLTLPVDPVV